MDYKYAGLSQRHGSACSTRYTWDGQEFCVSAKEGEFLKQLVLWLRPHVCLEIGTYVGVSASWILEGLEENKEGDLVTIEINPRYREEAQKRLTRFGRVRIDSALPDDSVCYDFVFIDGNHKREQVTTDFRYVQSHSHPGTLVALHDVASQAVLDGLAGRIPAIFPLSSSKMGVITL